MNGRCETDPLDRAVDVCDSCFGEFCDNCLLRPKGRRHPVCTECALIASGVRRPLEPRILGAKRTAKKRRAALKKQDGEETPVFEYFDAGDPLDVVEPPVEGKKRKKSTAPDEPVDAEPEDELTEVESHQAAGGLQLKIEQASALDPDAATAEQSSTPAEAAAATDDDEPRAEVDADAAESTETSEPAESPETSGAQAEGDDEASTTESTSAIKKLAELRKRSSDREPAPAPEATRTEPGDTGSPAEPAVATTEPAPQAPAPEPRPEPAVAATPEPARSEPETVVTSTAPDLEPAVATAATADPSPEAQGADEAVGVNDSEAASAEHDAPSIPDETVSRSIDTPAPERSPRPAPRRAAARPKPERPAVSYPGAERRRRKTDGPGDVERPKTTAPMIGEVRTIGSRRSTDVPEPETPAADLDTAGFDETAGLVGSADGAHNAIAEFDAGQPATAGPTPSVPTERRAATAAERADQESGPAAGPNALVNAGNPAGSGPGKADTDAEGNWIPPILRGMAPNVREAKADLPKRNRDDDEG